VLVVGCKADNLFFGKVVFFESRDRAAYRPTGYIAGIAFRLKGWKVRAGLA